MEKVTKRWHNWLRNNKDRYDKMDTKTKVLIQGKRILEHIVTGNIYIEFDKWIDHLPKSIDYGLGSCTVKLISTKLTDLEKD